MLYQPANVAQSKWLVSQLNIKFQLNVNHPKSLKNLSGLLVTMISLEKHTEKTRLLKLIRIHCKNSFPSQAQQVWRECTIFPYRRYRIPVVKTNCNMSANREQLQLRAKLGGISGGREGQSVVRCPPASIHRTARCLHHAASRHQLQRATWRGKKKHNSHEQRSGTAPGSVPLGNLTQKH